jgi:hypothetical protein
MFKDSKLGLRYKKEELVHIFFINTWTGDGFYYTFDQLLVKKSGLWENFCHDTYIRRTTDEPIPGHWSEFSDEQKRAVAQKYLDRDSDPVPYSIALGLRSEADMNYGKGRYEVFFLPELGMNPPPSYEEYELLYEGR